MATYDSFWNKAGPGLLDFGAGLYTKNAAQHEAADKLGAAQGPLYQQSANMSKGMLDAVGGFDPQAFATDRFNAKRSLMAPVEEKEFNDLYRKLYAKGQLGVANYNPGIEGITPDGTAMNPQLAAFFAAKNAQRAKDANASLGEGQAYIDSLLNRSGMLQKQASSVQSSGLEAQKTQPSRAAQTGELLRGVTGVLKDAGVYKDVVRGIPGALGSAGEWLSKTAGNMWNPTGPAPAPAPAPTQMAGAGGSAPAGISLGGGLSIDPTTGAVAGGSAALPPNQRGTAPGGGTDIGGGLTLDEYGQAYEAMPADFFDIGGGLGLDEFGNVFGGSAETMPNLTPADFGGDMSGFTDLGGGLFVDSYGNVVDGFASSLNFGSDFQLPEMDFSGFDFSGLGDWW